MTGENSFSKGSMTAMEQDVNGFGKVVLQSENGWKAEVYSYGAQVISWREPSGKDVLFLSKSAVFSPPKAIRGGIPVCFPQFADMGPCSAQHGFARNSEFELVSSTQDSVTFVLHGLPDTHSEFAHHFDLFVHVRIGDAWLEENLNVVNHSVEPIKFTVALHTYFRIYGRLQSASIKGLSGITYLDSLQKRLSCMEKEEEVRVEGEIDRIYCNAPDEIHLKSGDVDDNREIILRKNGFSDLVVWNPHIEKSKRMGDFGDNEWREMVCLEVAQAGSGAIQLETGQKWHGSQHISVQR